MRTPKAPTPNRSFFSPAIENHNEAVGQLWKMQGAIREIENQLQAMKAENKSLTLSLQKEECEAVLAVLKANAQRLFSQTAVMPTRIEAADRSTKSSIG